MVKRKAEDESANVAELAKRVLNESALEVFVWAGGREEDLNDVHFGRYTSCYVRAVHNISKNRIPLYEADSTGSHLGR